VNSISGRPARRICCVNISADFALALSVSASNVRCVNFFTSSSAWKKARCSALTLSRRSRRPLVFFVDVLQRLEQQRASTEAQRRNPTSPPTTPAKTFSRAFIAHLPPRARLGYPGVLAPSASPVERRVIRRPPRRLHLRNVDLHFRRMSNSTLERKS
jgi:hypothetical protein